VRRIYYFYMVLVHHLYPIKFPINVSYNNISQLKAKKNMYRGSLANVFCIIFSCALAYWHEHGCQWRWRFDLHFNI